MDHLHGISNFVFTYGTLRKGQSAYNRFGLDKALNFVKSTTIPGLMYTMGSYPGIKLLPNTKNTPLIHGDLFEITDEYIVRRLDGYEGCDERNSDDGLYRRVLAMTTDGIETWIYEINGPQDERRLIKSGNWLEEGNRRYAG